VATCMLKSLTLRGPWFPCASRSCMPISIVAIELFIPVGRSAGLMDFELFTVLFAWRCYSLCNLIFSE
jgi:hypothetical protein